jgi:pyridoxine kinase
VQRNNGAKIMATVLAFSSQFAYGHAGNSAAQFALQRLGVKCINVPSVILSNLPVYPVAARHAVPVGALDEIFAALEANGWLSAVDAVLTGYMPDVAHVEAAARWVDKVREANPAALTICDPIIGDYPDGIYIKDSTASAIRELLLPRADVTTPNRFELAWLSGSEAGSLEEVLHAARSLGPAMVLVTSAPAENASRLANTLVTRTAAWTATTGWRDGVPHGTGDFIAGIFTAHLLHGSGPAEALALATASMDVLTAASAGCGELELIASQNVWADPMPWPVYPVSAANVREELAAAG